MTGSAPDFFYGYLVYGFSVLAGMGCLLIAGIYMMHIYAQLQELNTYMSNVVASIGRLGDATIAMEALAKETRTDFANATIAAIDALKLLRHEIEYQRQIAEIRRRKMDAEKINAGVEGVDWNYAPQWNQP